MMSLSVGKLRGLQQISTPDGFILLAAMDHRGGLRKLLRPDHPEAVDDQQLVDFKMDLCRALAPHASGVLLDPEFGAAQAIVTGSLPGHVGFLVALEKTGYSGGEQERRAEILPGWSVEKVKRMGASGLKLLVYYHPDAPSAAAQRELVEQVAEQCRRIDLLCVVEAISFPVDPGVSKSSPEFARTKADVVVRTAEDLTPLGMDVFKAEFPGDLRYEKDPERLLEACRRLDRASQVPWVILSEGVDYEDFAIEVEIAARAGASGYMAGRAVWKVALAEKDRARRRDILESVAAGNLAKLALVARRFGRPWHEKARPALDALARQITPTWYASYATDTSMK
ncbi:tagatose 1,6-diphosphate aldolase [Carboxydochorda subterranea]|uniref:Tagatose 1,6-diphosphate aldolase n=1 Tax=Carboxydichorda subterranea TaxID=3109565 RepID=A0ABZ1BUV3_9FIRM|nr:tagatose 1,6-diphosphate aldolase [Limnochorda sp. L945t]WRP16446.1 tagatose 1,6-diphosphate aldolase [Limnochorda sp. L945t]